MKTKSFRLLLFAAALALLMGCRSNSPMDSTAYVNYRESQPYSGPTTGFYDPWYGGGYYGSGYYGGSSVGVGISVPIIP